MNKFGQKGSITDEDFMINILNNLPKDYNVILDGLENFLTETVDDVLTINMIHKKLNHWYKKLKQKRGESRKRKSSRCVQ